MANEFYDISGTLDSATQINPFEQSGRRTLCRNQCGWLWTAIQDNVDSSQIGIYYSTDLGVTWVLDQLIQSPLGDVFCIQMDLDEDEVPHVFFQAGTGMSFSWLYSSKSNDDGTWSDPYSIYVAAGLVTSGPGGPADNFSGSWAFDNEGYIHGLWVAYDRPFTPPDSLPPSTNLFYSTNESGAFVTVRCLSSSESANADGTSNDVCACPAIAFDACGNLHATFMFSGRTTYTVGTEVVTLVVTNSFLRRCFFRKKKGAVLGNVKEMFLQTSQDSTGTNDVSRTYGALISDYRGSICCDDNLKAHFAYNWSAFPFSAETYLYYGRITDYQFLPYAVTSAILTGSDTKETQNPSVCVSQELGAGGEVTAYVLFEGKDFAIGGMTNFAVTNILWFYFDDSGVGITGLTNLTDRAEPTTSPNTMSNLNPNFLVSAQSMESKFILVYLEEDSGALTEIARLAKANAHAYQIPAYVAHDLMPCCGTEPDLSSIVLVSESVLNAGALTIMPDFPIDFVYKFDTQLVESEARHSVRSVNTLSARLSIRMNFRNIDSTTLTTIRTLIATAKGSKGYFTFTAPPVGTTILTGRFHILESSVTFAKVAPSIYAIGFTAEQVRN